MHGERRNAYKIFVGICGLNRLPRRPRSRYEDDIKLDLKICGVGVWTILKWLREGTSGRIL